MKHPCPVMGATFIESVLKAASSCPLRTMQEELAEAVEEFIGDSFMPDWKIKQVGDFVRNWKPGAK